MPHEGVIESPRPPRRHAPKVPSLDFTAVPALKPLIDLSRELTLAKTHAYASPIGEFDRTGVVGEGEYKP
jgi:hypothetical protein